MYKKNAREQANAWIKRDGVNVDWLNNEVKRAIGAKSNRWHKEKEKE